MIYKSCAKWPDNYPLCGVPDGITTDTHGSREAADAVCYRLSSDGFGGAGIVFPERVWVEEVKEEENREK